MAVLKPGKVPRRRGGKYLRHGLLKLPRNLPVVIEIITLSGLRISRSRRFRPGVFLAGMVHHKIHTAADPSLMHLFRQISQIFYGPQFRLHLSEIRHGIPAVVLPLGAFQKGHQMHIVYTTGFDIIQLFLYALQCSCKGARIKHHPEKFIAVIPVFIFLSGSVQFFQVYISLLVKLVHGITKPCKPLHIIVINLTIQPSQFIDPLLKPFSVLRFLRFCAHLIPLRLFLVLHYLFIGYLCQPGMPAHFTQLTSLPSVLSVPSFSP